MNLDENLTEEELDKLAKEGTNDEKCAAARHPNASLQTLLSLAKIYYDEVDQNPLLPLYIEVGSEEAIMILVYIARYTARDNRLYELAMSIWPKVRCEVAWNESTPVELRQILTKDKNSDVSVAAEVMRDKRKKRMQNDPE
jgi:hypothetical protein